MYLKKQYNYMNSSSESQPKIVVKEVYKNQRKSHMDRIRSSLKLSIIPHKINEIRQNALTPKSIIQNSSDEKTPISKEKKIHKQFEQSYEILQLIGQGANGYVKKCRLKANPKKVYAVKVMRLDQQQAFFLRKNYRTIRCLKHQNIIEYKLLHLNRKLDTCHLVMDYFQGKNLKELKLKIKDQTTIRSIFFQVFSALDYMHKNNVIHRDIKPDNILYNQDTKMVKIVDFGNSRKFKSRTRTVQMITVTGNLSYRAPEVLLGGGYNSGVDVWAAGVTLYEMITGYNPFDAEYNCDIIKNIEKAEVTFEDKIWDNYSKLVKDLLIRVLKKSNERLSSQEALHSLWFNNSEHQWHTSVRAHKKINQQDFFKSVVDSTKEKGKRKQISKQDIKMNQVLSEDEGDGLIDLNDQ